MLPSLINYWDLYPQSINSLFSPDFILVLGSFINDLQRNKDIFAPFLKMMLKKKIQFLSFKYISEIKLLSIL